MNRNLLNGTVRVAATPGWNSTAASSIPASSYCVGAVANAFGGGRFRVCHIKQLENGNLHRQVLSRKTLHAHARRTPAGAGIRAAHPIFPCLRRGL